MKKTWLDRFCEFKNSLSEDIIISPTYLDHIAKLEQKIDKLEAEKLELINLKVFETVSPEFYQENLEDITDQFLARQTNKLN